MVRRRSNPARHIRGDAVFAQEPVSDRDREQHTRAKQYWAEIHEACGHPRSSHDLKGCRGFVLLGAGDEVERCRCKTVPTNIGRKIID